jgi:hypothetical protein
MFDVFPAECSVAKMAGNPVPDARKGESINDAYTGSK